MMGRRRTRALVAGRCLIAAIFCAQICCLSAVHAQQAASAFTTGYRWDLNRRLVGKISPASSGTTGPFLAERYTYDAASRLTRTEFGYLAGWQADTVLPANWTGFTLIKQVDVQYDPAGNKIRETVSASGSAISVTQFGYDKDDRLKCTAVRMDPAQWGAQTDACVAQTSGPGGPDRITSNVLDAAGQLLQVRKAVGTPLEEAYATYAYNNNGKQTDMADARGNHAQFAYDGFDRQQYWYFPSPSGQLTGTALASFAAAAPATALSLAGPVNTSDYEQYGYDANGNPTSLRKRDGSTLRFTYDQLNRVTIKQVPSRSGLPSTDARSVYTSYDLLGHQLTATFDSPGGDGITNTYDALGRLVSTTTALDGATRTVAYQYDADGNRTRVTFPDGVNYANYSYDNLDRPTQIQRNGSATIAAYSYNADGTRASFTSGTSAQVATSYTYDSAGRLASLSNNPVSNQAFKLTISGSGTCKDTANNPAVCYNPAGQITQMKRDNNAFIFTALYNVTRPYAVNGLNQYTSAGPASFTYDANGDLTSDGSTQFLYDIENRLVSATGAKNAQLRYDPLGRLYEVVGSSGTTRFLYGGDELMAEYDGSGNLLRRYVHGPDLKADDPVAWYEGAGFDGPSERLLRPDWQGSIALVADNAGQTVYGANSYDEYGIPAAGNVGRFQYTGQAWLADLGMYYYKARMYSPTLGRFMQTDPIGYKDQVNLYAYVANDPMDHSDFSGEESNWLLLALVPGQAQWDKAVDAAWHGNWGAAAGHAGAMLGEQVFAVATLGEGTAALQTSRLATTEISATAAASERAAQVHSVLDPIAQTRRTTAVLETNTGRVVAGGRRDLTAAQRAALGSGETAARAPGAHAEVTALQHAAANGATPQALAASRPICASCAQAIRNSGGTLTSPTTATWSAPKPWWKFW